MALFRNVTNTLLSWCVGLPSLVGRVPDDVTDIGVGIQTENRNQHQTNQNPIKRWAAIVSLLWFFVCLIFVEPFLERKPSTWYFIAWTARSFVCGGAATHPTKRQLVRFWIVFHRYNNADSNPL